MHRVLASLRVTKATSSTSKRFEGRRAHVKHLSFHTQICSLSTHNVGCASTYLKRSTNKFFSSTGESTNSGPAEPRKAHELIGLACPCTSPAVMAASLSSRRKRNEGKYIMTHVTSATLPVSPLVHSKCSCGSPWSMLTESCTVRFPQPCWRTSQQLGLSCRAANWMPDHTDQTPVGLWGRTLKPTLYGFQGILERQLL